MKLLTTIFSKVKLGVTPEINALATIIIGIVLLGVIIAEGLIAVEAEDTEEVKELGRAILIFSEAIGVRKAVVRRANSVIEFADKKRWNRVRTELDLSFVRPGASGDDVEHRAFARAIRADDDAELTFIHVEVEVVDRLEAVEGFADAFERENELFVRRHGIFGLTGCATGPVSAAGLPKSFLLSSRNCSGRPMIPFGMKSVTKTKSAPRM